MSLMQIKANATGEVLQTPFRATYVKLRQAMCVLMQKVPGWHAEFTSVAVQDEALLNQYVDRCMGNQGLTTKCCESASFMYHET